MWKNYEVELKFTTPFASSTPKHPKDITAMLEAKAPSKPPEGATPLPELATQIAEEVEATEEVERGYATFKRDENGLYYEARCVRAHIKDCASQIQGLVGIKAFKAKVANRVYVEPARIYLGKREPDGSITVEREPVGRPDLRHIPLDQLEEKPDGTINIKEPDGSETRFIHAMTQKGPRSSVKTIDFVNDCKLTFRLKVLEDGVIDEELLKSIFDYGSVHGIGQERSQDWGKYELVKLKAL